MRYAYQGHYKDGIGHVVGGGTITVYLAGTSTLASVYAANTGGSPVNSVTSNTDTGYFIFYVDTEDYNSTQLFDITLSKTNYKSQTYSYRAILPKTIVTDPYVDVRAYGAVGDGTDDSTVIQSTLTVAGTKEVLIPAGFTFRVKNLLLTTGARVRVDGTLKLPTSATDEDAIFKNSDTAGGNSNIRIYGNGTLNGDSANQGSIDTHAVYFDNVNNAVVEIREVTDFKIVTAPGTDAAIKFIDCTDCEVRFTEAHTNMGGGIDMESCINCGTAFTHTHDNTGSGIGGRPAKSADTTVAGIGQYSISDHSHDNGNTNISISYANARVIDPHSYNSAYSGLTIGHAKNRANNCQVHGGKLYNNTFDGLTVQWSKDIRVIGTEIYGNGANGGANDRDNIRILGDSNRCKFIGTQTRDSVGGNGIFAQKLFNIVSSNYDWTASGSGTNEYYLKVASYGADPGLDKPFRVLENSIDISEATVGSLTAPSWDYGDNDSLGYNTIYVRLTDGADPDSKAEGFVQVEPQGQHEFTDVECRGNLKHGANIEVNGCKFRGGAYKNNSKGTGSHAGILFNNCSDGYVDSYVTDDQSTKTQDYGVWTVSGGEHTIMGVIRDNLTTNLYETSSPTNMDKRGIKYSTDPMKGVITVSDSQTTTTVTNGNVQATSDVIIQPSTDASFVGRVSSVVAGTSFTITHANSGIGNAYKFVWWIR